MKFWLLLVGVAVAVLFIAALDDCNGTTMAAMADIKGTDSKWYAIPTPGHTPVPSKYPAELAPRVSFEPEFGPGDRWGIFWKVTASNGKLVRGFYATNSLSVRNGDELVLETTGVEGKVVPLVNAIK